MTDQPFGAVGDGRTDATAAIQRAIDQASSVGGGTVEVPSGTYRVNPVAVHSVHGLMMRSGVTLRLADDAVLWALPTDRTHYSVVSFVQVRNAHLIGGTMRGERYQHTGDGGEWGHGVSIQSSQNITVSHVTSTQMWGDGFYVGQAWKVEGSRTDNVTLCRVTSPDNRRQGLSIVDATNVKVLSSTFSGTHGTKPSAGLDIEPEPGNLVENVEVRDSVFERNAGDGIVLTWGPHNQAHIKNVLIEGNRVLSNNQGIMLHRALQCRVINNTVRNGGNQTNMWFPMTIHLFEGASGNVVKGNVHIGGKTVDKGTGNTVADAATRAGVYIVGTPQAGQTVKAQVLDTDGVPAAVSYQWLVNGEPVPGATAPEYRLTSDQVGKTITVSASFTDGAGHQENETSEGAVVKPPQQPV